MTGKRTPPRRCDVNAYKGTGTGTCDRPLDAHGQCDRANLHVTALVRAQARSWPPAYRRGRTAGVEDCIDTVRAMLNTTPTYHVQDRAVLESVIRKLGGEV